jgi:hypothetical protein
MEVQGYMSNPFGIILFYKVVGWFDGQEIWRGTKDTKIQFPLPTYNMWSMYIYIYTLYMWINVKYVGGLWIGR